MNKLLIALLITALILCGCAVNDNQTSSEPNKAAGQNAAITNDVSAAETASTDDIDEIPAQFAGKKIVEQEVYSDIAIFPSLENLIKYSSDIVSVKVNGFEYIARRKYPWTIIDATVTNVVSGDIENGQDIKIYTYGGYITLEERLGEDTIKGRGLELTEEERNTVLHVINEFSELPEIGKEYYFLLIDGSGDMPEGVYERHLGNYSQLEILDDNTLLRCHPADESEPSQISIEQFYAAVEEHFDK